MKEKNAKKLIETFPELLKTFVSDSKTYSLRRDQQIEVEKFWCSDGWYNLIFSTLEKLELIRNISKINFYTSCIKEKFAYLRIYLSFPEYTEPAYALSQDEKLWIDIINDVIEHSEKQSSTICEKCSDDKTAKIANVNRFYIQILCDKCLEETKKK